MKKTAFFTMDVESFGDISCLKTNPRAEFDNFRVEQAIDNYLNLLEKYGIKATFFVLCSSLKYTKEYLKRAVERGHEIALHGLSHEIPALIKREEFTRQIEEGKELLEREFNTEIIGYRAPCFAVTDEIIEVIRSLNFKYDSSALDIKMSYYRTPARLEGFEKVCDGILTDGGFYEISPCKRKTVLGSISVSGGGYLRLAPHSTVKREVSKFLKASDYYMFYCHPSDIFAGKLPKLKGVSLHGKYFVKAGRKNFLKRTEEIIKMLKERGYTFSTMRDFVNREN